MAEQSVHVQDIGPIRELTIPLPPGGGVVVAKGWNGSGKSRLLEAVQALGSAGVRPDVRDGAPFGSVDGLGVRMTLGRRRATDGELAVRMLEGADPSVFVDPGIKDPAANDRKRIAWLCRIAGIKPRRELFARLAGGDEAVAATIGEIVDGDQDLPDCADKLKRALEAAARVAEKEAEGCEHEALGLKGAFDGLDLNAPSDEAALARALREAGTALDRAEGASAEAARQAQAAAAARERLAALARENVLGVEDAVQEDAEAVSALAAARARASASAAECQAKEDALVAQHAAEREALELRHAAAADALRAEVQAAKRHDQDVVNHAGILRSGAARTLEVARRHAEEFRQAQQALAAECTESCSPEQLEQLSAAARAARQAAEHGAVVRRARQASEKAGKALLAARDAKARAERLRGAAAGCEAVISEAIAEAAPMGLRVESSRMVLDTDRGTELVADLSVGERVTIGIELCARAIGSSGLMVVQQEGWESLDPRNREVAVKLAQELGVWIIAAEATDGELRTEVEGASVEPPA